MSSLPPSDPDRDVDPRLSPTDGPTLDDAGSGLVPAVAGSANGSGVWLAVGGAILLGLLVFLWLGSRRAPAPQASAVQASSAAMAPAAPTPPEIDAMQAAGRGGQPLASPPALAIVTPPPAAAITPPPLFSQRSAPAAAAAPPPPTHTPVLVVDLGEGEAASAAATAAKPGDAAHTPGTTGLNSDEQFAARVGATAEPERARATMLHNQSTLAPQGTIIPAVLETALNSDLPGFARAVVSRDVRGFDGTTVLVPRGSRVIGEYRSAVSSGQSRIFVIWTRVLRPDGGSIQIGSGGGDPLGRAGLAGKVDRHFFERFSGAVLLTVLDAAAYAAAGTPSTQVVVGSSSGSGGLTGAATGLVPTDISPTIKVAQGSPIRIFVSRDLDFTPIGAAPR